MTLGAPISETDIKIIRFSCRGFFMEHISRLAPTEPHSRPIDELRSTSRSRFRQAHEQK